MKATFLRQMLSALGLIKRYASGIGVQRVSENTGDLYVEHLFHSRRWRKQAMKNLQWHSKNIVICDDYINSIDKEQIIDLLLLLLTWEENSENVSREPLKLYMAVKKNGQVKLVTINSIRSFVLHCADLHTLTLDEREHVCIRYGFSVDRVVMFNRAVACACIYAMQNLHVATDTYHYEISYAELVELSNGNPQYCNVLSTQANVTISVLIDEAPRTPEDAVALLRSIKQDFIVKIIEDKIDSGLAAAIKKLQPKGYYFKQAFGVDSDYASDDLPLNSANKVEFNDLAAKPIHFGDNTTLVNLKKQVFLHLKKIHMQ